MAGKKFKLLFDAICVLVSHEDPSAYFQMRNRDKKPVGGSIHCTIDGEEYVIVFQPVNFK